MSNSSSALISRLKVCLVTILELEEALHDSSLEALLRTELFSLKQLLGRIDDIQVQEDDVLRIEQATERFLDELRIPLQGKTVYKPALERVLQ